jgi:hypothetical protein
MVRDLALDHGTRLVHIGPHKTGTTAVQGALHIARERLADHGVVFTGEGRHPWHAAWAVTGRPPAVGERPPRAEDWLDLVAEVAAAADRRVVVSSEFFADGDDEAAHRVVSELGGGMVHVVVTLRPLARILPSQWQQYVQNRLRHSYEDWLEAIFKLPPYRKPTPTFWGRHDHGRLVARWARVLGDPKRLTAIVVDESDQQMLLRTFEALLDLPEGFLVPEEDAPNRSLTVAEAEFVRLLNHEFKDRGWPDQVYSRYLRFGAVMQMKSRAPAPDEPRIHTPRWALERAAHVGAEAAEQISGLGVRIIGDISTLGRAPAAEAPRPATTARSTHLPPGAAANAIMGAIAASGDPDVPALRLEDRRIHDVTAVELMRVLATRVRRRLGLDRAG